MDYGRLNRRELQALCKEHGIPANKTNVFMAEALGALLNVPKEKAVDSGPDPAEVVKARISRGRKAAIPAEEVVVNPTELDDLSTTLAQSTLNESFAGGSTTAIKAETSGPVEEMEEPGTEEEEEAPVKVYQTRRGRRTAEVRSKAKQDKDIFPGDVVVEETLPVSSAPLAVDEELLSSEPPASVVETIDTATKDAPNTKVPLKKIRTKGKKTSKAQVMETEEMETVPSNPVEDIPPPVEDELKNEEQEEAVFPSSEETVVDPPVVREKAAGSKKSKAKGTRTKKNRVGAVPAAEEMEIAKESEEQNKGPIDSPTYGLTIKTNSNAAQEDSSTVLQTSGSSATSSPVDETFEFQPMPESFNEIMSSDLSQETAVPAPVSVLCLHRAGRRNALGGCVSCASERKVAELMQGMLNDSGLSVTGEEPALPAATTPTKPQDDKENNAEAIPLEKLSMKKLKQKLHKRGLSKRNNAAAAPVVQ